MTARELYEANATDYPHIRWEALAPREKEGWKYAATLLEGVQAECDRLATSVGRISGTTRPGTAFGEGVVSAVASMRAAVAPTGEDR